MLNLKIDVKIGLYLPCAMIILYTERVESGEARVEGKMQA